MQQAYAQPGQMLHTAVEQYTTGCSKIPKSPNATLVGCKIFAVVLTRATHAFCKILNYTLKGAAVKWAWTFSGTFAIMLAVSP
jgi:hypothetical protein